MASVDPPREPPTSGDLLNHPLVQQALEQAWNDSLANDPIRRHEEGGWIYMEIQTGQLSIKRSPIVYPAAIDLNSPPLEKDAIVVGKFHTHPHPTAEGWDPGPSSADQLIDAGHGVPDLIRADDGVHLSGPQIRRGGLGGGPGFPP
jgi:hypothetical protein